MQNGGGPTELGSRRLNEKDEKHDDAGAQLSAIVDTDAGGLVVKGVEGGKGDVEWCFAICT